MPKKVSSFVVWEYTYAKTYNFLINTDAPNIANEPAIKNKPELNEIIHQPYLDAYNRLSRSRPTGYGPGNIPVSEILIYWNNLPLGDKEDFLHIIQTIDDGFLKAYYDDPKNSPNTNVEVKKS